MSKIEGNLSLFIEKIINDIYSHYIEEINSSIQQAYEASKNLVSSAYEEAVRKSTQAISDYYNEAMGEIKSYEVGLDRDNRIEIQNMEASLINEVLDKVYQKLLDIPVEKKEKLYEKLLLRKIKELSDEKIILYVCPYEVSAIEKIIDENQLWNRITLLKDENVEAGFIVTNHEKTIFYDFTLRTIYESIKPYLMSKARAFLFGDEK